MALLAAAACRAEDAKPVPVPADAGSAATLASRSAMSIPPGSPAAIQAALRKTELSNVVAYIPPQCFTRTLPGEGGHAARNPCYVCHVDAPAPNFAADANLQVTLALPLAAARNPWTNLFKPAVATADRASDDAVLRYVRESNYFDAKHDIALTPSLASPPPSWDVDGDGAWEGFRPDVEFAFDDRGFDRRPDGTPTGWRAFAYYPFPGTFFPTNGSADDVLVRLDPRLQQDRDGRFDEGIYALNLAIVEALITRSDVAVDPVDEAALGVDVDRDGRLGRASRVVFDGSPDGSTRMHYAGKAGEAQDAGAFPIAVGLFPLGTEFFHTVRYLDVEAGVVKMAARMKEVRYAKKTRFLGYENLRGRAAADVREQAKSRDGVRHVNWLGEPGIDNGQGWVFQGFIEDAAGALRPQTREETTFCAGCHGGIGATSDSIFSFPRKLGPSSHAGGWFHWSQRDLRGLPEPRRTDGRYEYSLYLEQAGAGDELRENTEVLALFFDASGAPRADAVRQLHDDIARLLLPSAARALDLNRAYQAIVAQQAFARGRDAVLGPSRHVYEDAPVGQPTGIAKAVAAASLVR